MRVLVTGADGFVGRHLTSRLAGMSDVSELIAGVLHEGAASIAGRPVVLDVTDPQRTQAVIAAEQPSHLFHLAAISAPMLAGNDVQRTWRVNVNGTLNVALAILEQAPHCRMIHCSSADVYGASFRSESPLDETAVLEPTSVYGASKAAADLMIGQMARQRLRAIRLRPFNHSGPGQTEDFVVPAFAAQIARIEQGTQAPSVRVGDLTAQRDFMDVADVIDAYVATMLRFDGLPRGAVLNLASGRPRSIRSILDLLATMAKREFAIVENEKVAQANTIPMAVGDAGLAKTLLDWQPRRDFADTVAGVLDFYRHRGAS